MALVGLLLLLYGAECHQHRARMTYVTALYNIGRGNLSHPRTWDTYLDWFHWLLQTSDPIIVFGEKELGEFVA